MPNHSGHAPLNVWIKAEDRSTTVCPYCKADRQSLENYNTIERFAHEATKIYLSATITKWRCLKCNHEFYLVHPDEVIAKVIANHEKHPRKPSKDRHYEEVTNLSFRARQAFYAVVGCYPLDHNWHKGMTKDQLKGFCHAARILSEQAEAAQNQLDVIRTNEQKQYSEYKGEETMH